jgi:hypothetical protein
MFWRKCSHTREDGLPYLRGDGICEECSARIRPEEAQRLHYAYAEKKQRALAAPRPTSACACPLLVRIDGKSFSIPAPKRSPLHHVGCAEWYDARAMHDAAPDSEELAEMEA